MDKVKKLLVLMVLIGSCTTTKTEKPVHGSYISNPSKWEILLHKLQGHRISAGSRLMLYSNGTFRFSECQEKDSVFGKWDFEKDKIELIPDSSSRWSAFYPSTFFLKNGKLYSEQHTKTYNIIRILELKKDSND